ncbi:MAG: cyclophilin family peptidyl-prolyl cis-trans isomerase [Pseudohongiellaceae bacterium]|jgi:cyclophilin family peptidyl-prolyl cis-trans isomerase
MRSIIAKFASYPIALSQLVLCLALSVICGQLSADSRSALLAMESSSNPLLQISTSRGNVFVELYPEEAPENVGRFLGLAAGEIELVDENTDTIFKPRYYDGMSFHRVIPGLLIQAGSPTYNALGAPNNLLNDEINANSLGLNTENILLPDSTTNPILNITSSDEFAKQILQPLYQSMAIETAEQLLGQEEKIAARLHSMTIKELYELQGYTYSETNLSRPIEPGVLALANSGPNSNGPEFFISMANSYHLSGKYTAIGSVIEGMDVVGEIGSLAINPLRATRASTVIYAIKKIN